MDVDDLKMHMWTDNAEHLAMFVRNKTRSFGERKHEEGGRDNPLCQKKQMNSEMCTPRKHQQGFADGCGARKKSGEQQPGEWYRPTEVSRRWLANAAGNKV